MRGRVLCSSCYCTDGLGSCNCGHQLCAGNVTGIYRPLFLETDPVLVKIGRDNVMVMYPWVRLRWLTAATIRLHELDDPDLLGWMLPAETDVDIMSMLFPTKNPGLAHRQIFLRVRSELITRRCVEDAVLGFLREAYPAYEAFITRLWQQYVLRLEPELGLSVYQLRDIAAALGEENVEKSAHWPHYVL